MTSVMIVADAPALRARLKAMLGDSHLKIAGETAALKVELAAHVDVLLLASDSWREELAQLAEWESPPGVVMLGDDHGQAAAAQRFGLPAWAVLARNASSEQVKAAVEAVASGLVVMPPEALSSLTSRQPLQVADSDVLEEPLTAREREVLDLLSEGLSNKMIARRLNISEHTVKFHVSSTYGKLGAANRTEAVSHAARRGLITL